jgi:hypothetical protein
MRSAGKVLLGAVVVVTAPIWLPLLFLSWLWCVLRDEIGEMAWSALWPWGRP